MLAEAVRPSASATTVSETKKRVSRWRQQQFCRIRKYVVSGRSPSDCGSWHPLRARLGDVRPETTPS